MMNMKTKEKGGTAWVVLSLLIFGTGTFTNIIPVSASEISPQEPELLWKYDTGEWIGKVIVEAIEGDYKKEVIAGSGDTNVYVFKTI
jgi:hypothetical protein